MKAAWSRWAWLGIEKEVGAVSLVVVEGLFVSSSVLSAIYLCFSLVGKVIKYGAII